MATRFFEKTDEFDDYSQVPPMLLKRMNRFRVSRADNCINCGLCEALCPYGVHRRIEGHVGMMAPADIKCIGPSCSSNPFYCVKHCPTDSL
ncbi:MAG TPA: 4Fe-4S dicluster domain-containing protein, partial [Methanomassiliicoccales archaeon]|nr:4Fe-4S dicluster domain-containing protein [Methanomassiliicoccales archaeon]